MFPFPSNNDVPLQRSRLQAVFDHQQSTANGRPHSDSLVSPVPLMAPSSNDNDKIPAPGLFLSPVPSAHTTNGASSAPTAGHPDDFLVSPVPSLSRTAPGSAKSDEQMLTSEHGNDGSSHKDQKPSVGVAVPPDDSKYRALMEERRLSLISPDFQPSLPMFSKKTMAPAAVAPIPTKPNASATTLTAVNNGSDNTNNKLTVWESAYATSKYFPVRLHRMIEQESQRHANAVHWSDDGLAFYIDNKESDPAIENMCYSSMSSLRRQFNTYGFKKMIDGVHKGFWFHPMFARTSSFDQLLSIKIEKPRSSGGGSKSTGKVVKPKKRVVVKEPRFLVVKNPAEEKEEPVLLEVLAKTASKEPSLMVSDKLAGGLATVTTAAPSSTGPPAVPFASQFLQPPCIMQEETESVPFGTPAPAPALAWMGLETLADVAGSFSPLFDIKSLESSLGKKPSSPTLKQAPRPSASPLASPIKMSVSNSSFAQYLSHPSPIMTLKSGSFQTTTSPFSPLDALCTPLKRIQHHTHEQQQAEESTQEDTPVTSAIKYLERKQDAVLTTDTFSTTTEEIKKLCSAHAQV